MQLTIIVTFRIYITIAHSFLSIVDYISFPLTDFISILSQCILIYPLNSNRLFFQQFFLFIKHITLFLIYISFGVKNFDMKIYSRTRAFMSLMVASDCVYFHMAHGFIVAGLQKKKYFLEFKRGFSLLQRRRKHESQCTYVCLCFLGINEYIANKDSQLLGMYIIYSHEFKLNFF